LHFIHSHVSGLQAIQHYRYFAHFQYTVAHALGFLAFTSRILTTDLSQSHCNFKSTVTSSVHRLIPFLPFLQLPIPQTRLDYCCIILPCFYYCCIFQLLSYPTLLITTLHAPHGKHHLLLSRMRVYSCCLATDVLLFCTFASAGIHLPTRCLAMGIQITIYSKIAGRLL
jgi:hypothetical protein